MTNPKNENTVQPSIADTLLESTLEVTTEVGYVTIPISRLEELIKAETERDAVIRAMHTLKSYMWEEGISCILDIPPATDNSTEPSDA